MGFEKGYTPWNKGATFAYQPRFNRRGELHKVKGRMKQKEYIFLSDGTKAVKVLLTKNLFALIDDEDFERVNQYKWQVMGGRRGGFYAFRNTYKYINGKKKIKPLKLHRFILKVADAILIDHINTNSLDCRKINLRYCSVNQNAQNKKRSKNNTSGYKGVSWDKSHNLWKAQIKYNKGKHHLGYFKDKVLAAKSYDKTAKKQFGEFSQPNF